MTRSLAAADTPKQPRDMTRRAGTGRREIRMIPGGPDNPIGRREVRGMNVNNSLTNRRIGQGTTSCQAECIRPTPPKRILDRVEVPAFTMKTKNMFQKRKIVNDRSTGSNEKGHESAIDLVRGRIEGDNVVRLVVDPQAEEGTVVEAVSLVTLALEKGRMIEDPSLEILVAQTTVGEIRSRQATIAITSQEGEIGNRIPPKT